MITALIFDFDGLILETEGPSYQSWVEVYRSFGQVLPFSSWCLNIGTSDFYFDPHADLRQRVGGDVNWEKVEATRIQREDMLIKAQHILPGVVDYLRSARHLGMKIGLASSSSRRWVTGHLTRLGLLDYFDLIRARDDVAAVKPDPELYLSVLKGLDVKAGEVIALEDSPLGVQAARRAGIWCLAVPNMLTRQLDLGDADLVLASLEDLSLEQLLNRIRPV